MANVGLSVSEGVSNGLTAFQEPSKRNIGLIMERERGIENAPTLFSTLAEDKLLFGDFNANMYGQTVVRNLIKNAQGAPVSIYGMRVVGAGSTCAIGSGTLNGTQAVTLSISAGQYGKQDKGTWGNYLVVKFYTYGYRKRERWYLEVYYKGNLVEKFENTTCAAMEIDIKNKSNYIVAEFSAEPDINILQTGVGMITSVSAGITEVLATATAGVNASVTAGDVVVLNVLGITLGSYTVKPSDNMQAVATALKTAINSGTHGFTATLSGSTLTITAPVGSGATYNGVMLNPIGSTGSLPILKVFSGGVNAVLAGNSAIITGVSTNFSTLSEGSLLYTTEGKLLGVVDSIQSATQLTLTTVSKIAVTSQNFKYALFSVVSIPLSGGIYNAPKESDFYPNYDETNPSGLSCFDGVDVQILATTEYHTLTMAGQGRDYCTDRKDCLFVANLPMDASDDVIEDYAVNLQSDTTSFIAGYNAWVKTSDGIGDYMWCPAVGCILGAAYIRVPYLQGDFIHIPPAGMDSSFVDVLDVTPSKISQVRLNKLTEDWTVNSVVFQEKKGWFVMTSRTYSTNSLYHSIHIRMQTSYYVRILQNNLGWAVQRPNTPELKKALYTACLVFFKAEYENGALERSIEFKEACAIICDQSNNPVSQDRKLVNLDIDWIPTEATEKLRISLNRNDGQLLVNG